MKKVPAIIEIVTYVESTIDGKCINTKKYIPLTFFGSCVDFHIDT